MTESAIVVTGTQVHMHPGRIVLDELCQEAGGKNMVARSFWRALQQVRHIALQVLEKFGANGKWPHALATSDARPLEVWMQFRSVRKDA